MFRWQHLFSQTYTAHSENEDVANKFVDILEKDIKSIYQKFVWPKKIIFGEKQFILKTLPYVGYVMGIFIMIKLEIVVILPENIEMKLIWQIIYITRSQSLFQLCFIISVEMMFIYLLKIFL